MGFLLRAFSHQPIEAVDGEEGLEAALCESPDLIICDIHLPRLNGYEVAQRLKREPRLADVPLVAVTALAMVGDRDKVLAAGFDGYIAKPIEPESLVPQIESFLSAEKRGVAQPLPVAAPEAARPHGPPPGAECTVLVVDDSAANRHLMCHTLEAFGYRVLLATNGDEALALARERLPDVILSDLHMAGSDGIDLLRRVKAEARLADLPFVFISSTSWSDKEHRAALAMGGTRFILRPIEPQVLVSEINACLAEPKASAHGGRHGEHTRC
jgi:two-component system cell cycle response regulator